MKLHHDYSLQQSGFLTGIDPSGYTTLKYAKFYPPYSFTVSHIGIYLYKYTNYAATVYISVREIDEANGGSTPGTYNDTHAYAYGSLPLSDFVAGSYTWGIFELNTPLRFNAGEPRIIRLSISWSDSSHFTRWGYSGVGNPYSQAGSEGTAPVTSSQLDYRLYGPDGEPIWTLNDVSDIGWDSFTPSITSDVDPVDYSNYGFEWRERSGSTYDYSRTAEAVPVSGINSLPITDDSIYPSREYNARGLVYHNTYGWEYIGEIGRDKYFWSAHNDFYDTYAYQPNYNDAEDFKVARWVAQTFTPDISHVLRSLKVRLSRYQQYSTLSTLYVEIYPTDVSGFPDTSGAPLAQYTYPGSWVTEYPTYTTYEFGFASKDNEVGLVVTAGVTYAIVMHVPNGGSNDFLVWARNRNGLNDYYTSGEGFLSIDAGVTWYQSWVGGYDDYQFWEYGVAGVETLPVTNITYFAAEANAFVLDLTVASGYGFEWGSGTGGPYPYEYVEYESFGASGGYYSFPMSGLLSDTDYYVRAKVYDTGLATWLYGDEETWHTTPAYPIMFTDSPDSSTTTVITSKGEILDVGAENADIRGFVYGTTSQSDPDSATPGNSGYDSFVSESGDFVAEEYTLDIEGVTPFTIYYIRAFAHNQYGYNYGGEVRAYTGDGTNILYPIGDSSKGIRYSSNGDSPMRGNDNAHWLLMLSDDSQWYPANLWGYITGTFVYEQHWYNSNFYTDVYFMTNPSTRSEGILKIKYRAHVLRNRYPYGRWKWVVETNAQTIYGPDTTIKATWDNPNNYACEIFYDNPVTGSGWTLAEADAIRAGISLGHATSWGCAACTFVWLIVCWENGYARTDKSTYISPTQNRLNGTVMADEAGPCSVHFEWGPTSGYGYATQTQYGLRKGNTLSADITASGEIHYRTVLTTECGEVFYGLDRLASGPPQQTGFSGMFVRGDEIQAVFNADGASAAYRSPDFGITWYSVSGLSEVDVYDVGFSTYNSQDSFFGGNGRLYSFVSSAGEVYYYTEAAYITGITTNIDVDLNSPIATIATGSKLYKTIDFGETVVELLDQPIIDVSLGASLPIPSGA